MHIEGNYTLQATPEKVWQCFMDQQILLQTLPGVESIEKNGEGRYEIALQIQHAPLKGLYQGRVALSEQHYPYYYHLIIEGDGQQNSISGSGSIHLNRQNDTTVIAYTGTLHLSKQASSLSSSLVKGATRLFIQQFFNALAEHLRLQDTSQDATEGVQEKAGSKQQRLGEIIILEPTHTAGRSTSDTLFHRLARTLRLGAGNPAQEELWESRLKRISFISGLLLLVWVGTRIPRHK
jgi:uncharacterized protein